MRSICQYALVKRGEKRAVAQISRIRDFKEKCIKVSYDRLYELKADVSKYFPSIYTHSIPWALHTKKVAKSKEGRTDKTLLGNQLDEAVRKGQSGQTKGIPIGTDTSRIIAEIIGTALDVEFVNQLKLENIDYKGYRFIDDYQLYFKSGPDAEKALKILHKLLNDYSLDLNEEKTVINAAPYKIDNDWSYLVNSCPLKKLEAMKISFYDDDVEIEVGEANIIPDLTDEDIADLRKHLKKTETYSGTKKKKVKVESTY